MKLTKLKKVLLSLLLLNTLVACKYQVEFEQLDSEGNVITNNIEIIDQPAEILEHRYNSSSRELALKVLTTSYVGELKADLEMSHCTESYPSTCYAKLNAYSQRIKSEIDFGLPSVMVKTDININLGELSDVGVLVISDDANKQTRINLELQTADRRHRAVAIESVTVNGERGTFTINAKHQICDGPGELELDYLHYTQNEPQPTGDVEVVLKDEPLPIIQPITPPREVSAQLIYRVKGGQPEVACKLVEGFYFKTSKTFSFSDAGVIYGQALTVLDMTKKLTRILNVKQTVNNLLSVANVEVDMKSSTLIVTSASYVQGKVNMKPCAIADNFLENISYQSCEADFVSIHSSDRMYIGLPALRINKFSLNEVGLGQNNSQLILNFQGGRALINIDRFGRASVKIDRVQSVGLAM